MMKKRQIRKIIKSVLKKHKKTKTNIKNKTKNNKQIQIDMPEQTRKYYLALSNKEKWAIKQQKQMLKDFINDKRF